MPIHPQNRRPLFGGLVEELREREMEARQAKKEIVCSFLSRVVESRGITEGPTVTSFVERLKNGVGSLFSSLFSPFFILSDS